MLQIMISPPFLIDFEHEIGCGGGSGGSGGFLSVLIACPTNYDKNTEINYA